MFATYYTCFLRLNLWNIVAAFSLILILLVESGEASIKNDVVKHTIGSSAREGIFDIQKVNNLLTAITPLSINPSSEAFYYTHQGMWPNLIYILSSALIVYLIFQKRFRDYAVKTKHTSYPDAREFYNFESDKMIKSFNNDDLIAEVKAKNKELATVTMHLVERGKLIAKVKEELSSVIKNNELLANSNDFKAILRMLSEGEKNRHDWEQFSIHFDEVHRNFLSVLKSQYPALSTTDLKLCAYLKLNLSSKEIAKSMNITLKGVEVSRYRLRKKLNISKDVNLFDYLLRVSNSELPREIHRESIHVDDQEDDLTKFLSFFNKSMTAKFISQGGYELSGEGIIFKRPISHNK